MSLGKVKKRYMMGNIIGGRRFDTKSLQIHSYTHTYMLKKVHGGSDVGKTVWFSEAAAVTTTRSPRPTEILPTFSTRNEIQGLVVQKTRHFLSVILLQKRPSFLIRDDSNLR